jgi:hypothetical protein
MGRNHFVDWQPSAIGTARAHTTSLKPLPYHVALCDFLKSEQEKYWDWFAPNKTKREQAQASRSISESNHPVLLLLTNRHPAAIFLAFNANRDVKKAAQ